MKYRLVSVLIMGGILVVAGLLFFPEKPAITQAMGDDCLPEMSYGNRPPGDICLAFADVQRRTGVSDINNLDDWDWSFEVYNDSGIGCPQAFGSVEPTATRAYQFIFTYQGVTYDYRQTQDKSRLFLCTPGGAEDVALPAAAVPPPPGATPIPVEPSPTPVSTFTPTPPAIPVTPFENVLLTDDFSANSHDWETVQRQDVVSDLRDGVYSMDYTADAPGHVWFITPGLSDWTKAPFIEGDFEAEIDVQNIQSSTGEYRISLLFGMQNDYSDYKIINLYPAIWYWSLGDKDDFFLDEGMALGAPINLTDGQPHRFGVRVANGEVILLVDGSQIASSTIFAEPITGSVGFGIGSVPGDIATVHAEFDNLIVRGTGAATVSSVAAPTPTVSPATAGTLNLPDPVYTNLFFEDTFDNNDTDWETAQTDLTFSDVVNGVFLIEHTTTRTGFGWWVSAGINDFDNAPLLEGDYEVEVQVSGVQSDTGNYRLTVAVGVQQGYTDFIVWNLYMPEGRWALGDSSDLRLFEGQVTAPLPDFTTGVHTLGVQVTSAGMTFLVDRVPVATSADLIPAPGTVGFGLGSISGETSKVSTQFDNLQIRLP